MDLKSTKGDILALDVGDVRVGVARASNEVRLIQPLGVLSNDEKIWTELNELCRQHSAVELVVGLPRGLEGQETTQTKTARMFAKKAETETGLPVILQDEALTSRKAEDVLKTHKGKYDKGEVDALAAAFILEDFLSNQKGTRV